MQHVHSSLVCRWKCKRKEGRFRILSTRWVQKRTHPDTQARAHTHTRVSRERRGSTRGSHCTNYIYIYMHIVRHVPSLLPSLVWCYTWQLSSLRTLSISRVTYIYIYICALFYMYHWMFACFFEVAGQALFQYLHASSACFVGADLIDKMLIWLFFQGCIQTDSCNRRDTLQTEELQTTSTTTIAEEPFCWLPCFWKANISIYIDINIDIIIGFLSLYIVSLLWRCWNSTRVVFIQWSHFLAYFDSNTCRSHQSHHLASLQPPRNPARSFFPGRDTIYSVLDFRDVVSILKNLQ